MTCWNSAEHQNGKERWFKWLWTGFTRENIQWALSIRCLCETALLRSEIRTTTLIQILFTTMQSRMHNRLNLQSDRLQQQKTAPGAALVSCGWNLHVATKTRPWRSGETRPGLSVVADHIHSIMATVYNLLVAASTRITHHVTTVKSSETGFFSIAISSLDSNSNRGSINAM